MSEAKKPNQIGHVIRILDKYTLLIDAGNTKVSVGDTIQVYAIGDVIKGLDGVALSYYVYVKDELEVTQVEELYSVCEKKKAITRQIPFGPTSPMLEHTFTTRIQLKVNDDEVEPFGKFDNIIHVGDAVKLA